MAQQHSAPLFKADQALQDDVFAKISAFGLATTEEEFSADAEIWQEAEAHILPIVRNKLGDVKMVACFCVKTIPAGGSKPHTDHGCHSAVLHLNPEWHLSWGGDFLAVEDDKETIIQAIEFKPNRLVYWHKDLMHCHRPPTSSANQVRTTLIMRFEGSK